MKKTVVVEREMILPLPQNDRHREELREVLAKLESRGRRPEEKSTRFFVVHLLRKVLRGRHPQHVGQTRKLLEQVYSKEEMRRFDRAYKIVYDLLDTGGLHVARHGYPATKTAREALQNARRAA